MHENSKLNTSYRGSKMIISGEIPYYNYYDYKQECSDKPITFPPQHQNKYKNIK